MKFKNRVQYNEWLKDRKPKKVEALPLGRKHLSRIGNKKERRQK